MKLTAQQMSNGIKIELSAVGTEIEQWYMQKRVKLNLIR